MTAFELEILDWLQKLHCPALDQIMIGITHLGDAAIIWIIMAIVLLLMPRYRRSGILVSVALICNFVLVNGIIKNLVARTRPYELREGIELLINKPIDYSFPSGHTAAAFTVVFALLFAGQKKLWKAALVLAVLIAFSRMYLYVHHPSDILGGVIFGLFAGWLGFFLVKRFETRSRS